MTQQVLAQISNANIPTIGNTWTLQNLFTFVLNLVLAVGFSLTLIMLAMGFIQYVLAQGDKAGVEKAQKWVTYSVLGGLGLFLVFAIRSAMQQAAGFGSISVGNNVNI
jgi:hypothetical protein